MSVAVVTGGARGIGAGVAKRLRADGHRVAVLDVDTTGAEGDAVSFFTSEGAGYVTGQVLYVAGAPLG